MTEAGDEGEVLEEDCNVDFETALEHIHCDLPQTAGFPQASRRTPSDVWCMKSCKHCIRHQPHQRLRGMSEGQELEVKERRGAGVTTSFVLTAHPKEIPFFLL